MNITIQIDCGNAAFDDDAAPEVARILKALAKEIADYGMPQSLPLRDYNGNRVGSFKVTGEQP